MTTEQKAKLDPLRESRLKKSRELFAKMQSGELDREGLAAEQKKLNDEMLKELKPVLSDDQFKKVEEAVKGLGQPPVGQPRPRRQE